MTADLCVAGAASHAEEGWHTINWASAYRIVCRLQARIAATRCIFSICNA